VEADDPVEVRCMGEGGEDAIKREMREKIRRMRLWTAEINFRRLSWMVGSGRGERRKVRGQGRRALHARLRKLQWGGAKGLSV